MFADADLNGDTIASIMGGDGNHGVRWGSRHRLSRPNGINNDGGNRRRLLSPNEWAENRSPAQSNNRAERESSLHQKRNGHHSGRRGLS